MTTYDYETGRIETDIKFRVLGETCRLTDLPARIGNRYCMKNCPFNAGSGSVSDCGDFVSYIRCTHSKAEDSPNIPWIVKHRFYEDIRCNALSVL